jgi:hypothetical protein
MNGQAPIWGEASRATDGNAALPRPTDEQILQHLGAATMLCWQELPFQCQTQILNQANDVIGLRPMPGGRTEIVKLLLRREKA